MTKSQNEIKAQEDQTLLTVVTNKAQGTMVSVQFGGIVRPMFAGDPDYEAHHFILKSTYDSLKEELNRAEFFKKEVSDKNFYLMQENARLREALNKFGQHTEECICRAGCIQYMNLCDCGLDDIKALAGGQDEKTKD